MQKSVCISCTTLDFREGQCLSYLLTNYPVNYSFNHLFYLIISHAHRYRLRCNKGSLPRNILHSSGPRPTFTNSVFQLWWTCAFAFPIWLFSWVDFAVDIRSARRSLQRRQTCKTFEWQTLHLPCLRAFERECVREETESKEGGTVPWFDFLKVLFLLPFMWGGRQWQKWIFQYFLSCP